MCPCVARWWSKAAAPPGRASAAPAGHGVIWRHAGTQELLQCCSAAALHMGSGNCSAAVLQCRECTVGRLHHRRANSMPQIARRPLDHAAKRPSVCWYLRPLPRSAAPRGRKSSRLGLGAGRAAPCGTQSTSLKVFVAIAIAGSPAAAQTGPRVAHYLCDNRHFHNTWRSALE